MFSGFSLALPRAQHLWSSRICFRVTTESTRAQLIPGVARSSSGRGAIAPDEQVQPLGSYYQTILDNPTPYAPVKPEGPPSSTTLNTPGPNPPAKPNATRGRKPKVRKAAIPPETEAQVVPAKAASSSPTPSPPPSSAAAKARIVFGSPLAGPAERAERLAALRSRSRLVAGFLVPPRPEEPDNCCMSGCVNCVWDRYRDEMEEWLAADTEAKRRLAAQEAGLRATASQTDVRAGVRASSVGQEVDRGGSETNWEAGKPHQQLAKIPKDLWDDELYRNVPVGIREFMKHEKRLKEKHI